MENKDINFNQENSLTRKQSENESMVAKSDVQAKILTLQKEIMYQKEHVLRVKKERDNLESQLMSQTFFCANIGAILGNLLWKSAMEEGGVKYILNTRRIRHFFHVASGILVSYLTTYKDHLPDTTSNETQFVVSICGTAANIAAITQGARKLISEKFGKEYTEQVINALPLIPSDSGETLRRILLVFLHNISQISTGLKLLKTYPDLIDTLSSIIKGKHLDDIMLLSLRMIESFSYDISTPEHYSSLHTRIGKDIVEPFRNSTNTKLRIIADGILVNYGDAEYKFNSKGSRLSATK